MPSIEKTTKAEVLRRFTELVKTADPRFAHRTYLVSGSEPPRDALRNDSFLTVSMRSGTFDWPSMVGGAVPYDGTIGVTIWLRDMRDQQGTDEMLILSSDGLFDLEQKVMAKVFDSTLSEGLADADETHILSNPVKPVSDSETERTVDDPFGGDGHYSQARGVMVMEFAVQFHWDLT